MPDAFYELRKWRLGQITINGNFWILSENPSFICLVTWEAQWSLRLLQFLTCMLTLILLLYYIQWIEPSKICRRIPLLWRNIRSMDVRNMQEYFKNRHPLFQPSKNWFTFYSRFWKTNRFLKKWRKLLYSNFRWTLWWMWNWIILLIF